MGWLLLWPLLGLVSWCWMSYNAHQYDGLKANQDPLKWWLLGISPISGPLLGLLNVVVALLHGRLYWGLRLK